MYISYTYVYSAYNALGTRQSDPHFAESIFDVNFSTEITLFRFNLNAHPMAQFQATQHCA